MRHYFKHVAFTVKGRNQGSGSGDFVYLGSNLDTQYIVMDKIQTKQTQEKRESDRSIISIYGDVKVFDSLMITPNIQSIGKVRGF